MPDYAKTVIYQIECKDVNITKTYGGHTTNLISRRREHKSDCNNTNSKKYNQYVYRFIRDNGGWDNWQVVWQYDYPCGSRREAEKEETNYIKKYKCELNCIVPYASEMQKKENETAEEKAERLRQKREYETQRIAKKKEEETEEEKKERLGIKKEHNAKYYAKKKEEETEEEKKERLQKLREKNAKKRENETAEEKKSRSEKEKSRNRNRRQKQKENETPEEKAERLRKRRERDAKYRAKKKAEKEAQKNLMENAPVTTI